MGRFFIDHCLPFGLAPAGGLWGLIADAIVAILLAHGIGPTFKWVDDFLFFRLLHQHYTLATIREITAPLGLPWHTTKCHDFDTCFTYLGFNWDLTTKTVTLPFAKQQKFLLKVTALLGTPGGRWAIRDVQSVHGSLNHVCQVLLRGRPYTSSLSHFASSFDPDLPLQRRYPPPAVLTDLQWWVRILSGAVPIMRSLQPLPAALALEVHIDASSAWGLAIVVGDTWQAWRWKGDWKGEGRDIGWAETVAVELLAGAAVAMGLAPAHVHSRSDNDGTIGAFNRGRGRNQATNRCLIRIQDICAASNLSLSLSYIPSEFNRADRFSRGDFDLGMPRLSVEVPLNSEVAQFLEVAP